MITIILSSPVHLESSVGYGDITCETEVGRVFQLMFLAVGLVSHLGLIGDLTLGADAVCWSAS